MARIYTFLSGKGGAGKSTLSSAIASVIGKRGKRVLMLDGDAGLRCDDLMLNAAEDCLFDWGDAVKNRCAPEQAMTAVSGHQNVYLLPAPLFLHGSDRKGDGLQRTLEQMDSQFDVMILDGPAGLGHGAKSMTGLNAQPLLVVTPDPVCIRDAEWTLRFLRERGEDEPKLLVNRVQRKLFLRGETLSPQAIASRLEIPLLSAVPDSKKLYRAFLQGRTADECGDRRVMRAIEQAADEIMK